jgi:probable DNA metabolism protein
MNQMELFNDELPSGFQPLPAAASGLDALLEQLEIISPNAHDEAVYALLSEFPIEAEVFRFARKIIDAAEAAGSQTEAGRNAAERAHTGRLDPDTEKVQGAAWKVAREFDRMRGLLRFSAAPGGGQTYIARCAPDHFVLPLLADHFLARFGETPWAIIDEKRGVMLIRERGKQPLLRQAVRDFSTDKTGEQPPAGGWEQLWRTYHQSINNEDRINPKLQKQCMPKRYWKYLPEMAGL